MINKINELKKNLTANNIEETISSYQALSASAPRCLIGIGKKDQNAVIIRNALNELLDAMRRLHNAEEAAYYSMFDEDQYEG